MNQRELQLEEQQRDERRQQRGGRQFQHLREVQLLLADLGQHQQQKIQQIQRQLFQIIHFLRQLEQVVEHD